jgi:hypothetical protein
LIEVKPGSVARLPGASGWRNALTSLQARAKVEGAWID